MVRYQDSLGRVSGLIRLFVRVVWVTVLADLGYREMSSLVAEQAEDLADGQLVLLFQVEQKFSELVAGALDDDCSLVEPHGRFSGRVVL